MRRLLASTGAATMAAVVLATLLAGGTSVAAPQPTRFRSGVEQGCRADGRFVTTETWINDDVAPLRITVTNDAPGLDGPTPGTIVVEPGQRGSIVSAFKNGRYQYTRTTTFGRVGDPEPAMARMTEWFNQACPGDPLPAVTSETLPPVGQPAPAAPPAPPAPPPPSGPAPTASTTAAPAPTVSVPAPTTTTTAPTTTEAPTSVAGTGPPSVGTDPVPGASGAEAGEEVASAPAGRTVDGGRGAGVVAIAVGLVALIAFAGTGAWRWRRRTAAGPGVPEGPLTPEG